MRKKFMSFILALCLIVPAIVGIVGCGDVGPIKTATVFFNLNHSNATKNAKFTDEFWTRNKLTPGTSVGIATGANFNKINNFAPKANEIEGPTIGTDAKKFAGWYLDSQCSDGMQFNEENWDREYDKYRAEGKGNPNLYAKWINSDETIVYFDLGNQDSTAKYKDTYLTEQKIKEQDVPTMIFNLDNMEDSFATKLPTANDINCAENLLFKGWYFEADAFNQKDVNKLTIENINNKKDTEGISCFTVYARFETIPETSIIVRADSREHGDTDQYRFLYQANDFLDLGEEELITFGGSELFEIKEKGDFASRTKTTGQNIMVKLNLLTPHMINDSKEAIYNSTSYPFGGEPAPRTFKGWYFAKRDLSNFSHMMPDSEIAVEENKVTAERIDAKLSEIAQSSPTYVHIEIVAIWNPAK